MNKTFLKQYKVYLLLTYLISSVIYTGNAFADDNTGITVIFCNVINEITGGVGKVISVLILISMSMGLFLGKITWGLAICVMVGMGLMFGAKGIVDLMSAGTSADRTKVENLCPQK